MKQSLILQGAVMILLLSLVSGCASSQKNTMYFAAVDIDEGDKPRLTLYRLNIRGKSSLVKGELQSGFYDANTVRTLFGEVTKENSPQQSSSYTIQPENSTIGGVTIVHDGNTWRKVAPSELFTIVYGADSRAITDVIKATAQAEDFGTKLGGLMTAAIAPTALADLKQSEIELQQVKSDAETLANDLEALANSISGETPLNETEREQLMFLAIQKATNAMESTSSF